MLKKLAYTFGRPRVMETSSPSLGLEGAGTCSPVILEYINWILRKRWIKFRNNKNKSKATYLLRPRMLTRESKPNNSNFDSPEGPLACSCIGKDPPLLSAPILACFPTLIFLKKKKKKKKYIYIYIKCALLSEYVYKKSDFTT